MKNGSRKKSWRELKKKKFDEGKYDNELNEEDDNEVYEWEYNTKNENKERGSCE